MHIAMNKLHLSHFNDVIYRVLTQADEHVGNLKLISGRWKFKAIGYDDQGDVLPGGGPLTDRHNLSFDCLDEALISQRLLAPSTPA
jgi:hypothetical protein